MYSEIAERKYFSRLFINMAWAMAITAITAYAVANYPPLTYAIASNITGVYILMFFEVVLVWYLSSRIMQLSVQAAFIGFMVYSLVNGVTLSIIFLVYDITSISTVFLTTAGLFLVMGLYGYNTKKDLSPIGRFLIMSLFGLIIATVINFFLHSASFDYLLGFIGVLIFSGLTAYDIQRLKYLFENSSLTQEDSWKISILGALSLYLDFINLFLMLLRLFGRRR